MVIFVLTANEKNKRMMRSIKLMISLIGCLPLIAFSQTTITDSWLKEGNWYKIAVTQTGVHRLDRTFLSNLGITPASFDPRNIRLFTGVSGMLPQANNAPRPEGLQEVSIQVVGESDGQFGPDDYVLFFAESPHVWKYNQSLGQYNHELHLYADTNFYYLTVDRGTGLRITEAPAVTPTYTPSQSEGLTYHEVETDNPIHSGRYWLGELFDGTLQQTFPILLPDADKTGQIRVTVRVNSRSSAANSFQLRAGNQTVGNFSLPAVDVTNPDARYYQIVEVNYTLDAAQVMSNDSLNLTLVYNKGTYSRAQGWLDFIEVEYDQAFKSTGKQQEFNLLEGTTAGAVAGFSITGATAGQALWNISSPRNPKALATAVQGGNATAAVSADAPVRLWLHQAPYLTPQAKGKVANQNLRSMDPVDYLIITHASLRQAADSLAAFHQQFNQRSTAIVTPAEIYHEYSGGKQDVAAIRDFIRNMYQNSGGVAPHWVVLLGDGTYDYKGINPLTRGKNLVPTYQSRDSWDPVDSYTSDDFFVLLEPNEGFWGENSGLSFDKVLELNTLDVAIGRLPAQSLQEALDVVKKTTRYATDAQGKGFGTWRNRVVLVGDYKENEGSLHISQVDSYTNRINQSAPCLNIDKIYLDNYPVEKTAGRTLFPEAKKALLRTWDEGALLINYTGHGGEQALSNSYIMENPDIERMQNFDRLPAVITATCEFGRFDLADMQSGGEALIMNPTAGAITMFTTVRLVYSSPNKTLNDKLYDNIFTYDQSLGRYLTTGETMMRTKNASFPVSSLTNLNSRNFTLLGDPGLTLALPKYRAQVATINGQPIGQTDQDSLRSLSQITLSGVITDPAGNLVSDYSGTLDATLFDKPAKFTTLLSNYVFYWQKNRLFNGKVAVTNGTFDVSFVVPIDISYEQGLGKFAAYFSNSEIDGNGCYNRFFIGGTDETAAIDAEGPKVELFLDNDAWVDNATTGPDPDLFAKVFDISGINTTGNGIGHEITAVLDNDESNILILNNYYTAQNDSYQAGTVRYPIQDLAVGRHTLRIRVWDVANNPAEDSTTFFVVDDAKMAIAQVLNYPNPFSDNTNFLINHNQPGKDLAVSVEIVAADGSSVITLDGEFSESGSVIRDLEWDGKTAMGTPVSAGIYFYRVTVREKDTNRVQSASSKLVIIR